MASGKRVDCERAIANVGEAIARRPTGASVTNPIAMVAGPNRKRSYDI
jgi:hypothetical protein